VLIDVKGLGAQIAQRRRARVSAPTIKRYMDSHRVRALHLGAGGNLLKGWLNTDLEPSRPEIAFADVLEPLPFTNNSLDFVYSEHLIEHIKYHEGVELLRECFRALKPGGRLRVSTPDLRFLIDIYTQTTHTDVQARYVRRILERGFPEDSFYDGGFVMNHFVRHWGHQFIYDERTLGGALRAAGFADVRSWEIGQSDEPMLQNIEQHGNAISDDFNRLQSLIFEGTKPGA
jgi:predicted SAM-dependent methyltransferase